MRPERILLVHLVANGDCLMATTIARQIKKDFPGCRLTWAISYKCRLIIDNNPDVDDVWEIVYGEGESPIVRGGVWARVKCEAEKRRAAGEFDRIFSTQIYPDNIGNFDGTTRSSTFRNYPGRITVPVNPVIRLRDQELEKVEQFAAQNQLRFFQHVILFECTPNSGQSTMSQRKGLAVALNLVSKRSDTAVIISTHIPFDSPHPQIIDGACLSLRENVELSKYCTLFVGCSSGITWLLTSDSAKQLPMVLFLNPDVMGTTFASVAYDFKHWQLPTSHIIESGCGEVDEMTTIVFSALDDFDLAKSRYHETFSPKFWDFLLFFEYRSLPQMLKIFGTCRLFLRRNRFGWAELFNFGRMCRILRVQAGGVQRLICEHFKR
jgi:hypothetical protein